ncbi:MAG: photosynthetic complex assembly protein PuhC [Hydrogenophaga sp.]|uniref:photosynthetic complex assembly protein PuhC n=1 Tax=Hydrogenophaga sp. TaxID=1904254 RepID=UPI00261C6A79|nr:photosynthetic complex assembly protein PuhC [Hydrogenophaga sp.]MDM7941629.1 photosynthetic complex assembly protein PuhC [Hydrogenophaga sp.]
MSTQHHPSPLGSDTPWPIWVLGLLLLAVLAGVTLQMKLHGAAAPQPTEAVQWERSLSFVGQSNGDIAVLDAATRQEVARFQGEQGFLRGSLRALNRERKRSGMNPDLPFKLTGHVDGRITLLDTATGQRLSLESFGPTNSAVFSQLQWARPAS